MTLNEKFYAERYKETKDVSLERCYVGGKHCATCMWCRSYDSNWNEFECDYCLQVRKDETDA